MGEQRMNGKLMHTLLLFSLVFTVSGCTPKQANSYESLARNGDFRSMALHASKQFYKSFKAYDLYHLAFAQWKEGKSTDAYQSCELYLTMYDSSEATFKPIHMLLLQVALQTKHYEQAIESGKYLDTLGNLDVDLARLYYQALSAFGKKDEANQVFIQYLSKTLGVVEYAKLLINGGADINELQIAFSKLSLEQALHILDETVSTGMDSILATTLLGLVQPMEGQPMAVEGQKKLYSILAILYTVVDSRILARKYQTLSQK